MREITFLLLCAFLLPGCSPQSELDKANKKIAELQSQLEIERAKNKEPSRVEPASETKSIIKPASPPTPTTGDQWMYSQDEDKMSSGTTSYARTLSTNTVEFGFPYSGAQHATLALRNSPRFGKDVIFNIERGQILCHSYEDCTVLVRFDDGKASNYSATGASDNSTETIFIRNYGRFVENMIKAKTVRISTNIYQQGAPVFEFDVSDFDQSKYKLKK